MNNPGCRNTVPQGGVGTGMESEMALREHESRFIAARTRYDRMTAVILGAVLLLAWPEDLTGQNKFSGESFSRGVGGRGLGMGSAYVAVTEGSSSLYWNPAGISGLEKREFMAMHSESFGGEVDYDYLGFSQPISEDPAGSAIGIGMLRLGVSGFQETALPDTTRPIGPDNRPVVVSTFSVADYAFMFGYSRKMREDLRLGGNLKVLYRDLYRESATGFGFDFGLLYAPVSFSPLQFGVNVQDLTTTFLAYSTGKHERIYPSVRVGTATVGGIRLWSGKLILATDFVFRFEDRDAQVDDFAFGRVSGTYHIGGEYQIDPGHLRGIRFALRGGIDEEVPSAGAGVGFGRFDFDYAWLGEVDEDLGTSNRLSMTVGL